MKKYLVAICILILIIKNSTAQNSINDTLRMTRAVAETIFLEKNLQLIAEKLNIDQAEAQLIQARLWPNPTLTINEINLWSNSTAEELTPIFGNFGRTSQISAELEQVIITAGKRRKMIAMEKVTVEMSKQYFEDFLRNLKIEFRNNLTELQYTQGLQSVYKKQLESVQKLLAGYKNQVQQGNVSKSEYIRLKASELEYIKEIVDLQKSNNELQKELKILMNIDPNRTLYIEDQDFVFDTKKIEKIALVELLDEALKNRPDLKVSLFEEKYYENNYKYQRAQRTPDLTLSAGYDRGGNIMQNFVGFGVAMDLPFFSRNQGNIKAAKISIDQSRIQTEQKTNSIQSQVVTIYQNLLVSKKMYEDIEEDYEKDLDLLLESHQKNFISRNISMIEYLDFVEAYLQNKKIILDSKKEFYENLEELQFAVGKEI